MISRVIDQPSLSATPHFPLTDIALLRGDDQAFFGIDGMKDTKPENNIHVSEERTTTR